MAYRPNIPDDWNPPYYIGLQGCLGGGCEGPICVAGNETIVGVPTMVAGETQPLSISGLDPHQPCGELNYFWYDSTGQPGQWTGFLKNGSALAEGGVEWGGLTVDFLAPSDGTTSVVITLRAKHVEGDPDWLGVFCAEFEITITPDEECVCNDNEEYIVDRDWKLYGQHVPPPYNRSVVYWGRTARLEVLNRAEDSGEIPCVSEYTWEVKQDGYRSSLDFGSCPDMSFDPGDGPRISPIEGYYTPGSWQELCVRPPSVGGSMCPETYFRWVVDWDSPGYFDSSPVGYPLYSVGGLNKIFRGFGPVYFHVPNRWRHETPYSRGDQALYGNGAYVCLTAHTSSINTGFPYEFWHFMTYLYDENTPFWEEKEFYIRLYICHSDWPDSMSMAGVLLDTVPYLVDTQGAPVLWENEDCDGVVYDTVSEDSYDRIYCQGYTRLTRNSGVTTEVDVDRAIGQCVDFWVGHARPILAVIEGYCKDNPIPHSEHPIAMLPCICGARNTTNGILISSQGEDHLPDSNTPGSPVSVDPGTFINAEVYAKETVDNPCTHFDIRDYAFQWRLTDMEPENDSYIVGANEDGIYFGSSCEVSIGSYGELFALVVYCLNYEYPYRPISEEGYHYKVWLRSGYGDCYCSGNEAIVSNIDQSYPEYAQYVQAGGSVHLSITGRDEVKPCVYEYTWYIEQAPGPLPMLDYIDPNYGVNVTLYVEDGEYSPPTLDVVLACQGQRVATRSWTVIDCFCTCDPDIYGPAYMDPNSTVTLMLTGASPVLPCPNTDFTWEIGGEPVPGQCELASPFGYSNQLTTGSAYGTVSVNVFCQGTVVATIAIENVGCYCNVGETLYATETTIVRDGEITDLTIEDLHWQYPCGPGEYSWSLHSSSPADCELSNNYGYTNRLRSGHITGVARVQISCKASPNFLHRDIVIQGCQCSYGSIGVSSGCQGGASTDCEVDVGGVFVMYPPTDPNPDRPCYDDDYSWVAVSGASRCTLTPAYNGSCHFRAVSAGLVEIELECLSGYVDTLTVLILAACCGGERISGAATIPARGNRTYTLSSADCSADRYEWEIYGAHSTAGSSFSSSSIVHSRINTKSVTIYAPSGGLPEEIELAVYCDGNEMDSVIILSGCNVSSGVTILGPDLVAPNSNKKFVLVSTSGEVCPGEYYTWSYTGSGSLSSNTGKSVTLNAGGAYRNAQLRVRFDGGSYFDTHTFDILYEYDVKAEIVSLMCPTISLTAQVRNQSGNLINNLTRSQWTITRNPQSSPSVRSITFYTAPNPSYSIAVSICMDFSASMSNTDKARMREGARTFVDRMTSVDQAEVVFFAEGRQIKQAWTYCTSTGKTNLKNGINGTCTLTAWTQLYDCIYSRASGVRAANQKIILILTDGGDSGGSRSLNDCINRCNQYNVKCYTIGLGSQAVRSVLERIAYETDGMFLYAPTNSEVVAIYEGIIGALRQKYKIDFTTTSSSDSAIVEVKAENSSGKGHTLIKYNCSANTWSQVYEGYPPNSSSGSMSYGSRAIDGNESTYAYGNSFKAGHTQRIGFNFSGHPPSNPVRATATIIYSSACYWPFGASGAHKLRIKLGNSSGIVIQDTCVWAGYWYPEEVIVEWNFIFTSGLSWDMDLVVYGVEERGTLFHLYEVRPLKVSA